MCAPSWRDSNGKTTRRPNCRLSIHFAPARNECRAKTQRRRRKRRGQTGSERQNWPPEISSTCRHSFMSPVARLLARSLIASAHREKRAESDDSAELASRLGQLERRPSSRPVGEPARRPTAPSAAARSPPSPPSNLSRACKLPEQALEQTGGRARSIARPISTRSPPTAPPPSSSFSSLRRALDQSFRPPRFGQSSAGRRRRRRRRLRDATLPLHKTHCATAR